MDANYVSKKVVTLFSNYEYHLHNTFVFNWESDFFAISKSGYSIEVEIKVSKSDFKADFNKRSHVDINTGQWVLKHDALMNGEKKLIPNKFFFAFPEGLIDFKDVPDHYGIIEIRKYCAHIQRQPKFLHKHKLLDDKSILKTLMNKFYYRNLELKRSMLLRDTDIEYNQKRIYESNYF